MKMSMLVAVFMFGLITQGHAQMYCYVCENCPDGDALTDDFLVACGEEDTTDTTSPIVSSPTTPAIGEPTQSTNSPTGSTIEVFSDTPPDPSSVSSSDPTSEQPSVPPSEQTAEPPSEPSTVPSSNQPPEPSTEQTTIITTVDTPGSPIPTTSMEPGTEITFSTEDLATPTIPIALPTITDQTAGTPPQIVRLISLKQSEYNCFVIKKQVNNTEQVHRGCVPASPNPHEMCIKANENLTPLECSICATNQCNSGNPESDSGSTIIVSLTLVLCSIFTLVNL